MARTFEGVLLGPDDFVIEADEKSQLQALARCHPGLGPGSGRLVDRRHPHPIAEVVVDHHDDLGSEAALSESISKSACAFP